jgi:predicted dehydrogenase
MRLALISYSHHGRGIARTARDLGHDIVGVADGEPDPLSQLVEAFDCPGYETVAACLDTCQPDVAIVCGKHIEIPDHITACVDRRIPYLVDKPFADCADRLRPAAEASVNHDVLSALTLPNRATRLIQTVERMRADGSLGDLVLCSSRLCNGPPERYDPSPSYWHNDPQISGGGCWATEAAHGIDTFLQFSDNSPYEVVGSVISNGLHGREVEDNAVGMLRTESGLTAIIESGYTFPPGGWGGDHFFRFIGTKASIFEGYDEDHKHIISIHTSEGVTFEEDIDHGDRMRNIIEAGLDTLENGRSFDPDITQAVRILEVQDAVYAHARRNKLTNGPHPMGLPDKTFHRREP